MSKKKISKVILAYELIGFGLVILCTWFDELFDIPYNIFGAKKTPFNWVESIIETVAILILCALVLYFTQRYIQRIKYLEGFLPVCSFCKKIRVGKNWIPIEKYISEHSGAVFSHGLCPGCAKENYGEIFTEDAENSQWENE